MAVITQHPFPAVIRIDQSPLGWKWLHKHVKKIVQEMHLARDDARRAVQAISDKRQELWDAKQAGEARLKVLKGGPYQSRMGKLSDDDSLVVAEKEKLEEISSDLSPLNALYDARVLVSQANSGLVSNIEDYLNRLGTVPAVKLYVGPAPLAQKRERAADAFERCGRRLRELDADRHRIASAPWHSVDAKRRAHAEIDALAERGQPSVLPLIESPDEPIYWAERSSNDVVIAGRLISAYGDPATLPLLFWLCREALTARIDSEIDAVAADDAALTAHERAERFSAIDRDRLAIQRDEEYWFTVATKSGVALLRRPNADPRAVLGLSDDMPAPSNT